VSGSRSVSSHAARKRRPHDAYVPDVDGGPSAESGDGGEAAGTTAPELVGVHGNVDAARATL
jgi:hypothetical protein